MDSHEEPKQNGMDKLQILPMADRLVVMLNMLRDLQIKNLEKSGRPPLTKRIEIESAEYRAKAKAYLDTSCFIAKLFESELRERLVPQEEKIEVAP